jgi:predicted Zn-dependent protease
MPPHPLIVRRLGLGLLLLTACAPGCQSGPRPTPEFVQQADLLHQNALRSAVVRDRDLNDYFAEIGKRIIAGATAANAANTRDPTFAQMQFHLVGSDVVNAFGTGGRHIYVYNGLVQACQSEEELAALMAVQYAHALGRDVEETGMRPDVRGDPDRSAVDRVAFLYVDRPFSPAQLLTADELAFAYYVYGGWDPARFPLVYERLKSYQRLDLPPATDRDGQPRPTLAARASAARRLASSPPSGARNRRQPTVADAQTFRELKQSAEAVSRQMNGTDRAFLYLAAFPNVVLPADLPIQTQAQGQLRRDAVPPTPVGPSIEPS